MNRIPSQRIPILFLLAALLAGCSSKQANGDLSAQPDGGDATDVATGGQAADLPSGADVDVASDMRTQEVQDLVLPPVPPTFEYDVVFPSEPANVPLPDGVKLRVISLNVYGGKMATAQTIGAYLASMNVDLIGLQECSAEFGQQIAAAAGFPNTYGDGVVIMAKTALLNPATVSVLGGRGFVRADTVIGDQTFRFYNTHLSWNVQGNLEFRYFTDQYLKQDTSPRIVMTGDFNDEHYSTQNTIMEEWGLDCFTAAGIYPGQRISWPSFGFDDTEGSQLIDLVWFRKDNPAIVLSAAPQNVPGLLSDHKPVLAELLFPKGDETFQDDPFAALRDPLRGFPSQLPPNQLLNPGAEQGLEGWEIGGQAQVATQREHQSPRTGDAMFAGASEGLPTGQYWSWGTQKVDVSTYAATVDAGLGVAWVTGFMTTGYQIEEKDGEVSNVPKPYDDAELILEWLDGQGQTLGSWSSGRRDTLAWHRAAGRVALPPGIRTLRLTWMSHHKEANGPSNDGLFDDLYLGFGAVDQPHDVLGPNLLGGGGGESGNLETEAASASGTAAVSQQGKSVWSVATDLLPMGPWGIFPFAPWSWSGKGFLVATSKGLPAAERDGAWGRACWSLDLSPWAEWIDGDGMDLLATGWLRNSIGRSGGRLFVQFGQESGAPADEHMVVRGAEWTQTEDRQSVPTGAREARFCVEAQLKDVDDPIFADGLSVTPVRRMP